MRAAAAVSPISTDASFESIRRDASVPALGRCRVVQFGQIVSIRQRRRCLIQRARRTSTTGSFKSSIVASRAVPASRGLAREPVLRRAFTRAPAQAVQLLALIVTVWRLVVPSVALLGVASWIRIVSAPSFALSSLMSTRNVNVALPAGIVKGDSVLRS